MTTPQPDERLRQAAVHADKIRDAVLRLLDSDAAAAAQIRKGSDRILSVADQIHKLPLPTRSQVEHWSASHVEETRQYMFDAVKAWRTAAVAHEHAIDMYEVAADSYRKGSTVDTAGLRETAERLRVHACQLTRIDRHYDSDAIQPSIYACNEAIARINEKHTAIAARLNDTANKLVQAADDYDTPAANRPRCIRQRPN